MTIEKANQQAIIISDDEIRELGLTPSPEPLEGDEAPCYLTDEDREELGFAGNPPTFIRKSPQDAEHGNKS